MEKEFIKEKNGKIKKSGHHKNENKSLDQKIKPKTHFLALTQESLMKI